MKKKKNFKGFTLIEVLVALSVLAIMALMLSMMYVAASKASLMSNSINKHTDYQASLAATGAPASLSNVYTGGTLTFSGTAGGVSYSISPNVEIVEVTAVHTMGDDAPNIKYCNVKLAP